MDSYGTATALSNAAGLNSLTANSFANLGTIDNTTTLADDYLVDIEIANVTETGNKQILVYVRTSVDGTNFSEDTLFANLVRIGVIDITKAAAVRSAAFPIAVAFGGTMPPKVDVIVRNDAGVTLAGSGNSAQYRAVNY